MSISVQKHPFHLVDPSPWPIFASLAAFSTTVGAVLFMHGYQGGNTLFASGFCMVLYSMYVWWRDIIREATFQGHHTRTVQIGLRYGMLLFIVSEIMFFVAFFWAFFHSSLAPTIEIGAVWPPKGIPVLNPWEVPFLNTIILLTSGASVTWAHHALLAGAKQQAIYSLVVTVILAIALLLCKCLNTSKHLLLLQTEFMGQLFFWQQASTGFTFLWERFF